MQMASSLQTVHAWWRFQGGTNLTAGLATMLEEAGLDGVVVVVVSRLVPCREANNDERAVFSLPHVQSAADDTAMPADFQFDCMDIR